VSVFMLLVVDVADETGLLNASKNKNLSVHLTY